MRYIRPLFSIVLLFAPLSSGCRLPGREGPVPAALTDCRRLSQQGAVALDRGDQAKAELLLSQAVAACPVDAEAHRNYGEALWRRGARQEAIAQLEEAGRLVSEDASLWARLAEMHLANNEPEPARQDAERALNLDPKLASAWLIHGGVLRANGEPREALVDYLRALNYAPNDRTILLETAELHRQLNQPDQALLALQTLADTYTAGEEPPQVYYLQGLAYVAMRRYDDGVESFATAVARGKPTPEMLYQLGQAELLAGHPAEALGAAQQALALQPEHQPSRELVNRIQTARQPQGAVLR